MLVVIRSGGPPLVPGFCHPGPASDMFSRVGLRRSARPAAPSRLFTGALRATCRPSTSAIEADPRAHLAVFPNPVAVLAKRRPAGSSTLGRIEPAELSRARGRPATNRRFDARTATARRTDLPQFDYDSDTHMSRC